MVSYTIWTGFGSRRGFGTGTTVLTRASALVYPAPTYSVASFMRTYVGFRLSDGGNVFLGSS